MANTYSQADFNSMQQDAIRRVKEMQRRSQNYVNEPYNSPKQEHKPAPPPPINQQKQVNNNFQQNSNKTNQNNNGNNFQQNNNQSKQQGNQSNQANHNQQQKPNNNFQQQNNNPFAMFFGNSRPGTEFNGGQNNFKQSPPERHTEEHNHSEGEHTKNIFSGLLDSIFPNLHLDDDKIIIVILIIILAREGADIKLLLALGYLLM